MPEETIIQLKKNRKIIESEKLEAGLEVYNNWDLAVCTELGTPTNKSNIRRTFNSIIKKAKIPKIRFHDMRHTHATLLLL
ncbi:hypothetical protein MU858_28365 (plasmid) [Bacillus sp. PGP15]|uniref:hypothetical protein n=1 Tax=Bacillus TaxID=1386 RepID=UPI00200061FF|nr:hypothetical protein [Bacillus sp. PGP15]UPL47372.1 hypothetical protein MU858_28365 [Bacillus sp. PGP15]